MKRLLPVGLLVAAIAGLIIYLRPARAPKNPSATAVSSTPAAAAPIPSQPAAPNRSLPPAQRSASLPDEISRALRSGYPAERDRAFNALLPELIAQNASAAGRLAEAWEPGPLRDELIQQVTRHWAAADIGAAVAWLAGLETRDQQNAAEAATGQVAQADPAGALELAQALQVGTGDGSLEHLAQLWTEEKPGEAVAWVKAQPAGPSRDRLLARIAHVRAQRDPAEAADLVLNFMPAGPAQNEAVVGVVRQWAQRDLAASTAWVSQFPPGPLQTQALGELETARKLR